MVRGQPGFTLIELLAVVSIIGVLSAVIMTSLNGERAKSRDARRLADLNQIQKALELYYLRHGSYPAFNGIGTPTTADCTAGGTSNDWCGLETELKDFIPKLPRDPVGIQATYRYYYDSDSGNSNKDYGMMTRFEHPNSFRLVANDGGFYTGSSGTTGLYYEVGEQPSFCMRKSPSQNWWGTQTTTCLSSN